MTISVIKLQKKIIKGEVEVVIYIFKNRRRIEEHIWRSQDLIYFSINFPTLVEMIDTSPAQTFCLLESQIFARAKLKH
jgi:hypothetical protein